MTDDDWDNGYARAVGVFFNGAAIPTPDAFGGKVLDDDFYVMFNASDAPIAWTMPGKPFARSWIVELDTEPSHDHGIEVAAEDVVALIERSMLVLRAPRST